MNFPITCLTCCTLCFTAMVAFCAGTAGALVPAAQQSAALTGTAATFDYTDLPAKVGFDEWERIGRAGWEYAGMIGDRLMFRRTRLAAADAAQRVQWQYKQIERTAPLNVWNDMGDQGWQYFTILDKAVVFGRPVPAGGNVATNALAQWRWEYRQLSADAPAYEWSKLGETGWQYIGVFNNAIAFKRCKNGAAQLLTDPVATAAWQYAQLPLLSPITDWNKLGAEGWQFASVYKKAIIFKKHAVDAAAPRWEYTQLPLAAFIYQWNELGEQGWEYAIRFMQSIVFKRSLDARNISKVSWEYSYMPGVSDFGHWSTVGENGWEYADILDDKIVFKRKSTLGQQ